MRVSIPGIGGSLGECVLCGESFCMEVILNKPVQMIHVDGFSHDLPIHREKCLATLRANGPDWRNLPDGPLRKEFENAFGQQTQEQS